MVKIHHLVPFSGRRGEGGGLLLDRGCAQVHLFKGDVVVEGVPGVADAQFSVVASNVHRFVHGIDRGGRNVIMNVSW